MRDTDSAHAATSVATSGRSLMATLHSRDAVGTVASLRNLGLDDYELSANLGLVAAQRLVRKLCVDCRCRRRPDEVEKQWLRECGREIPEETWGAQGCPACDGLGFRGRTGIFEVWQPTEEDYAAILSHVEEHSLRHSLIERGHPLMLDDGLAKVAAGVTTLRELLRSGTLLPGSSSACGRSASADCRQASRLRRPR
ncbi:MAG: ATPase, T2SS/T4P/T4SS family [Haliea sp.]|uniref:ATPase, T2SS/T4P/T4SS family n=1 Tax=Haliea sp. TaxID=1932666 RepID=UPI0032EC5609